MPVLRGTRGFLFGTCDRIWVRRHMASNEQKMEPKTQRETFQHAVGSGYAKVSFSARDKKRKNGVWMNDDDNNDVGFNDTIIPGRMAFCGFLEYKGRELHIFEWNGHQIV